MCSVRTLTNRAMPELKEPCIVHAESGPSVIVAIKILIDRRHCRFRFTKLFQTQALPTRHPSTPFKMLAVSIFKTCFSFNGRKVIPSEPQRKW